MGPPLAGRVWGATIGRQGVGGHHWQAGCGGQPLAGRVFDGEATMPKGRTVVLKRLTWRCRRVTDPPQPGGMATWPCLMSMDVQYIADLT